MPWVAGYPRVAAAVSGLRTEAVIGTPLRWLRVPQVGQCAFADTMLAFISRDPLRPRKTIVAGSSKHNIRYYTHRMRRRCHRLLHSFSATERASSILHTLHHRETTDSHLAQTRPKVCVKALKHASKASQAAPCRNWHQLDWVCTLTRRGRFPSRRD